MVEQGITCLNFRELEDLHSPTLLVELYLTCCKHGRFHLYYGVFTAYAQEAYESLSSTLDRIPYSRISPKYDPSWQLELNIRRNRRPGTIPTHRVNDLLIDPAIAEGLIAMIALLLNIGDKFSRSSSSLSDAIAPCCFWTTRRPTMRTSNCKVSLTA